MKMCQPSLTQELIWLDQLISNNPSKYNIGGYVILRGSLSQELFEQALKTVLGMQEIYSAIFTAKGKELSWHTSDAATGFKLQVVDFSETENAPALAREWMEEDFSIPFQITGNNDHLFRITLLKITADTHYCYAKIHHIIADGWSFKLLLNQLGTAYDELSAGKMPAVRQYRYSDYVADDAAYQQSEAAADDKQFWLDEYATQPGELFKANVPNTQDSAPAGTATLFVLADLKKQLQTIAENHKSSVFQVIMGLLLAYLARTRQQTHIAVALPVLNRSKKVYKQTAGVFMNLICPVFDIDVQGRLPELLNEIRTKMYACLKHQRYQYGNLVKDLQTSHAGKPVYQLRVSYEDFDFNTAFGGLTASTTALSNHYEVEPLSIYIRDYNDQGFDVRFIYNKAYFNEEMINAMSAALMELISAVPHLAGTPVKEWPVISEEEKARILSFAKGETRSWPQDTFVSMWRQVADSLPGNIAVTAGKDQFTYRDIDLQVRAIANVLLNSHSFKCGDTIGLLLPRSADMVTGMLGCMTAGAVYMPIDPEEPADRIHTFLKNGACTKLIVSGDLAKDFQSGDIEVIRLEQIDVNNDNVVLPATVDILPESPCYVIHTSGSTGVPKAVAVSHHSFMNYVCHFQQYFGLTSEDVVLQHAAVSFDIAMEEIFPILGVGGRLCILDDRKNIRKIIETIEQERVSVISSTPLVLKELNDQLADTSLRLVISGGDILRPAYIDRFLSKDIPVYNTYGPTECTICATYHKAERNEASIAIGKPIANCNVYVLDKDGELQPVGVEGEICVGGSGVAIGYKNDKNLSLEKFIDHKLAPQGKLYRTGDIGKYSADGLLHYTGRHDIQLKVRGIRIEPREIERSIMECPGIRSAVVIAAQDPGYGTIPVAFVIFDNTGTADIQLPALRALLRSRLPEYMLPSRIIPVADIPLNAQGKPDQTALLKLMQTAAPDTKERPLKMPANHTEQVLMDIWISILDTTAISVTDNFFDLGGHSLKAAALVSEIYDRFDVDISIGEIFAAPTIRQLGDLISQQEDNQFEYVELC
ncbi:non-ribosomal peptide synthetase [Chitinophaga rhizophila]|uniref:Amino acid adenylation domain-containing protein n=1 Tax=Chitinophaga rhizophila TaxID=2866212 RepID=A0ABS7G6P2_9BACT|nr:non-ribosomal peptide synthetase [Chitinophaga rhizophila]MBW8683320.1 amino acid adenylation domain-containing protein [Chitinophaga rhizophila]